MPQDDDKNEQRRKSERELSEHDRIIARNAAHASRDTLHDASAWQEPGEYTIQEARDRAAHTPSILDRDGPRNAQERDKMIAALDKELFPTEAERQAWEQQGIPKTPPQDETERRQWEDWRQMAAENSDTKESNTNMTPEQQANIDKALQRADLSDKIGGATDVNSKPAPNDPNPTETARDVGQDMHKQGVVMDKE